MTPVPAAPSMPSTHHLPDGAGIPAAAEQGQAGRAMPEELVAVDVVFEDEALLAVNKPAGVVIHPAYRHPSGTLFDAVVARQAARGEGRPWLLHRLDRDTSGVVLLAKSERARRGIVRQFERHEARKWYLAFVHGVPAPAEGVVQQLLRRDPLDRRRVIVDPAGQTAITRYRVLAAGESMALLLVAPETGRTHQIRAHLAWLGHPLVGDATYANVTHVETMPAGIPDAARQMLHAWSLEVRHPLTGETLRLWAPLPPDVAALLPDDWRARCTPELFEDT